MQLNSLKIYLRTKSMLPFNIAFAVILFILRVFQVVLSPGEVLFVPRHWWHYVECVESAVSVNTWIELVSVHAKREYSAFTSLHQLLS